MSDGGGQGSAEEKRPKEGENKLQKGEASRAGKPPRRAERDRRVRGSLEEGERYGGRQSGGWGGVVMFHVSFHWGQERILGRFSVLVSRIL